MDVKTFTAREIFRKEPGMNDRRVRPTGTKWILKKSITVAAPLSAAFLFLDQINLVIAVLAYLFVSLPAFQKI